MTSPTSPDRLPGSIHKKSLTHRAKNRLFRFQSLTDFRLRLNNARKLVIPGLDDDYMDEKRYWGSQIAIESKGVEKFDLASVDSLRHSLGKKGPLSASETSPAGDSGNVATFFNLLTAFVGAGALAIPATFAQTGIIGGVAGLVFVGVINVYTMILLVRAKHRLARPITSYTALSLFVLSDSENQLTDFCVLTSQIGFVVSKFIFMGGQIEKVICYNLHQCHFKDQYIALICFVVTPICWLRSYKYLSYLSLASNVILFVSMGVIVKYCIDNHYAHPELANDLVMFDVTGYPLFFGLACAILEGNGIILNIESTMKTPEDFSMVLSSAVGFCLVVFCAFATIGYWSYGSTISDFIPLNLPHDDVTDFTQILFCFGLFSSIAL